MTIKPRVLGRLIAQKLLGCLPVEWGARVKVLAQGLSLKTEGFVASQGFMTQFLASLGAYNDPDYILGW